MIIVKFSRTLKGWKAGDSVTAAISHFAYNFCFGIPFIPFQTTVFNQTGVVWSLAWGLVLLYINDKAEWKGWQKSIAAIIICLITFPSDWNCIATLAILSIGVNRGNFKEQMTHMMTCVVMYAIVYFLFIDKTYALIQLGTCLFVVSYASFYGALVL